MRAIIYRIKFLILTCVSSMVFIIYLNVKYYPGRSQMLTELNEQLNLTNLHLRRLVDTADNPQLQSKDTMDKLPNPQVQSKETVKFKQKLADKVHIFQVPAKDTLESKPTKKHGIIKYHEKERSILCIRYIGGLGNIMFIYASAYSLSNLYGIDLVMPVTNDLLNIFNLDLDKLRIIPDYKLCNGLPQVVERYNCALDGGLLKHNHNTSFWIIGYLQSYKYFEAFADDIRSQFTFKRPIQEAADSIIFDITRTHLKSNGRNQSEVTLIGVHNRRGDMVDHPYGYNVGTKEYFKKAMDWFRSKYPDAVFVVCSNDIRWSKRNILGKDVYFTEGKPRSVDLAVLASCDHLVSSVGSFSWWASWLCEGTVIYAFPPAKEGSELRRVFGKDYSDYFPPKWIPL